MTEYFTESCTLIKHYSFVGGFFKSELIVICHHFHNKGLRGLSECKREREGDESNPQHVYVFENKKLGKEMLLHFAVVEGAHSDNHLMYSTSLTHSHILQRQTEKDKPNESERELRSLRHQIESVF